MKGGMRSGPPKVPPALAALLPVCLVCSGGAAQARIGSDIEIGGFVGAHFFSGNIALGRDQGSAATSLKTAAAFGLRVAYGLHPRFQIEPELLLAPTETEDGSAPVLVLGWRAHAIVHFLSGSLRPFLLFGGGGMTSSPANQLVLRQATIGTLDAGVGLKYDVRPGWGVRLDVRLELLRSTGSGVLTDDYEGLLGVYGRFGPGAAPVPASPASP